MAYLHFEASDIVQLQDVFSYFEVDSSGNISNKHLYTTLRCLEPSPNEDEIQAIVDSSTTQLKFEDFIEKVYETVKVIRKRQQPLKNVKCLEELTEKEVQEIKDSFKIFDQDGDGTISVGEMNVVMESMGQFVTKEEINEMIEDVDVDRNGSIEFEEFLLLMTRQVSRDDINHELKESFEMFDKDGDGAISGEELKAVMLKFGEDLSEEEIQEMIDEADLDGDGQVDYSEFEKMMNNLSRGETCN